MRRTPSHNGLIFGFLKCPEQAACEKSKGGGWVGLCWYAAYAGARRAFQELVNTS